MRTSELIALPLAERLQTMEALWGSLDNAVTQAMPPWHEPVVQQRLERVRDGSETTSSLEEAFTRIAHNIAARQAKTP